MVLFWCFSFVQDMVCNAELKNVVVPQIFRGVTDPVTDPEIRRSSHLAGPAQVHGKSLY